MEEEIAAPQELGPEALVSLVDSVGDLSNWVTAFATVTLAVLTLALVMATIRMAGAMARPHVVASIESNQWSLQHMDLVLENSGNSPAYDIGVKITPLIERSTSRSESPFPFSKVSLLRPGQVLASFVADFADIKGKTYTVEIEWKKYPNSRKTETLSYDLDMQVFEGVTQLGKHNPMIQVAEQIKHLREDWKLVAKGQRRTKVDVFDQDNRDEERRIQEEQHAELRRQAEARKSTEEG